MSLVVPEPHQQFQVIQPLRPSEIGLMRMVPAHSPSVEHQRRWKAQGHVRLD